MPLPRKLVPSSDGEEDTAAEDPALLTTMRDSQLVVATPVLEEESSSHSSFDEEEGRESLDTTTTATTVTAAVVGIVEVKPPTFSHKVNDVLRHKRGKCCFAIALLCFLGSVGGIAFFATDEPNYKPYVPLRTPEPTTTSTTMEPQSTTATSSPTEAPKVPVVDFAWDTLEPTNSMAPTPTPAPTSPLQGYITSLLPLASTVQALHNSSSPQSRALNWLLRDVSEAANSLANDDNHQNQTFPYSDDRLLQRFALATFYYATQGKGWRFQQFWMSSAHECEWYTSSERRNSRLVCNDDEHYTRLVLIDNILKGTLPPQVGLLTHLHTLQLQGDNFFQQESPLGGSVPSQLGLLGSSLELLHLGKNGFSGSLPTQLGQLTRLKTLKLLENQLTGSIPDELLLGNCSTTTGNSTDGCAPNNMALEEIRIYDNRFGGPLPTNWTGVAKTLQILDWGNNQFQGTVPSQLGLLTALTNLDVQGNRLTGTVPTQLGAMPSLGFLKVNDNLLTGTIPTQLGNLEGTLNWLLLKNNRLTGTIPTELGRLGGVSWLLLEGNALTGGIPTQFGELWSVRFLRLHENDLQGKMPDEVCRLQDDSWWFFILQVDCDRSDPTQDLVSCSCRACLCT